MSAITNSRLKAIHKMLEQVLKNQIEILVCEMDPQRHNPQSTRKSVTETVRLLEKVKPWATKRQGQK